ncbi:MAG: SDR family NAD(P)-dependent oxidoreductase, partial [Spirochaetota bacterium]|nr:SDR family NAD(P)-dependent oxidoreductase [Spirochaetota bacterium]
YPEDLIEFDLDMESDLGIDTVKQAEVFGLIREAFDIPQEEGIKIKDFPTLNHVVQFVKDKAPLSRYEKPAVTHSEADETKVKPEAAIESSIRRMTVQMIEEPIDTRGEQRFNLQGYNILITDDGRGAAENLGKKFTNSKANVRIIDLSKFGNEESLSSEIERLKKEGKINGIVHLASLEDSKNIDDISFEEWRERTFRRIKSLFIIAKAFNNDLAENAESGNAFLVSATQMGGYQGFENFSAPDPTGGGVVGITKSLNKELEKVLVKSIDFSINLKPSTISRSIYNEIQHGGNRVELGYSGTKRMVPLISEKSIDINTEPKISFGNDSVFIITGGGYGITSEIAKEVAEKFKSTIVIISRTGLPSNIEEIASLDDSGLKDLKNRITDELKSSNERVTPVMIEKEYGKYTTAIEKYRNVKEMKELGAKSVEYFECDVSNYQLMSETINRIRDRFGRIDAIIHGAGLEQSKLLEDKNFEDFCRVFDVKADGCFNLIELTKNDNVRALMTFSSIAGRFGNIGQTDYSAANDLMSKYVQHVTKRFNGQMKAVSIDWTGWQDVGMATRGSLLKIFEETGIELISLDEGVQRVREELLYGSDREVIIAGSLGDIDSDGLLSEKSGDILLLESLMNSKKEVYPLIDEILEFKPAQKIVVKKRLDIEKDIYLKDHAIENVPYMPAVMGIEAFAEASMKMAESS